MSHDSVEAVDVDGDFGIEARLGLCFKEVERFCFERGSKNTGVLLLAENEWEESCGVERDSHLLIVEVKKYD